MDEIKKTSKYRIIVTVIYFLVAVTLSVAGVFSSLFTAQRIFYSLESESWPKSNGLITFSHVRERRRSGTNTGGRNTHTYSPEVKYSFIINGEKYEGDNIEFFGFGTGDTSYANDTLSIYPIGKSVVVYFRPGDPAVNVLSPGLDRGAWVFCFVIFSFSSIGIIMLFKAKQFINELLGEDA